MNEALIEFAPLVVDAPYAYDDIAPVKPTIVFDAYWRFAAERQMILYKRINQYPLPWSDDYVLRKHKFTNAYRATDRVSQFLIRNVIYNNAYPSNPDEVFFRIMLFKLFNKIETWNAFVDHFKVISWEAFDMARYDEFLMQRMLSGETIYSAAYIMPSGKSYFGFEKKHSNHLALIKKMMNDRLPTKIQKARSLQEVFELLKSYPSLGDFLAYQYAIDVNYSTIINFSESEFVVPGPGAKSGISKCFTDMGGLSEVEIIRLMADRQEIEFERLGLDFKTLGDRRLQLIDCQNLFCETDKYARVMHPSVKGKSNRLRIKQNFTSQGKVTDLFLPPKWGVTNALKTV